MNKLIKKGKFALVVSLTISTVVWSIGLAAFTMPVIAASAGDLIKQEGQSAVYYVGSDTKRYVFPSAAVFSTWYSADAAVTTVTSDELLGLGLGGNVVGRAGRLLQFVTSDTPWAVADATVYSVTTDGVRQAIDSAETAAALFGDDWETRIMPVEQTLLSNYTEGAALTSASTIPDGFVITDGTDTYVIDGGEKRLVDAEGFTANGLNESDKITVADLSGYADGAALSGAEDAYTNAAGGAAAPIVVEGTSGLTVALAAGTPAAGTSLDDSDGLLFTSATFSAVDGDVVVTGLNLKRDGLGVYGDFEKVWLEVDGKRRGSVKSLNSADTANLLFSADTSKVTIADGTSKTFEIWASMINGAVAGHLNSLGITAVTTSSDVTGLPVTGNEMSHSNVDAPGATITSSTIGNSADIGDTGVTVSKFKITNGETNQTSVVKGITFKSVTKATVGQTTYTRAYTTDFGNFKLYDNSDNVIAGPVEMGSDNYLTFALDTPFEVAAGTSKFEWFYVKADILDGAGRTLNLSLEGLYDVKVYGGANMYRSTLTDSYTDADEYVTLNATDLTISVDQTNNPIAADVLENTTIVLLKANITASKGAVNADGLTVVFSGVDIDMNTTTNPVDVPEFDNLRVYINNTLVSEKASAGIGTADGTSSDSITAAFTDSFTVDGVVPVRVEIDIKDLQDANDGTIAKATINGGSITGTTEADGTSVTGSGTASGNNQSVVTPGYKIYRSATPVSVIKVLGETDVEFLGLDLKSNNTTDITVNKLKVELKAFDNAGSDFSINQNDALNVELVSVDGTVLAGPLALNSSRQVEFTGLGLNVTSNGTKVIVRADINSSINDAQFDDDVDGLYFIVVSSEGTANNNNYAGANSAGTPITGSGGNEVNVTTLIKVTVASTGTLTATLASDTPTSKQMVALSTDNEIAKWKLVAANEDIQVKKFRVGLTTGPAGEDEIKRIGLYEGSTKLAETYSFSGGYTEFDITSKNFVVQSGSGNARYLTMKVDLTSTSDTVLDSGQIVAGVLIDLTAWGAINEVAPISGATTDGFAFNAVLNSVTCTVADATTTDITMSLSTSGVLDGDIIKCGTEQMYVTSGTGTTTLVVIRGFNGSTAAAQAGVTTTVARSLEANNNKVYGNKITIASASTTPSGSLAAWGTYTSVFKFKLVPDAGATEEAVFNGVKVSAAQSTGIGTSSSADWAIDQMALYNGAGTKIAEYNASGDQTHEDTFNVGTDYVILDSTSVVKTNDDGAVDLSEAIASGGEEYTIKVITVGTVATNDSLQLTIANLGTISADDGDLEWDDSTSTSTAIKWVDMGTTDSYTGGVFTK